MNYLFWNTHKNKEINSLLLDIIREYNCDIIALAEYEDSENELLALLSKTSKKYYAIKKIGCKRITLITNINPNMIEHFKEAEYYTIKSFPHTDFGNYFIAFVHFPSKMYLEDIDYIDLAAELNEDLEDIEKHSKSYKSIIIGDFNMNPFENAMIANRGFSSVSCENIAMKEERTVRRKKYRFFYNPMWNMFGDINSPPGSYYYKKSTSSLYFWNVFDQVLIRPELCGYFKKESLKIIVNTKNTDLVDDKGLPKSTISDHLPIFSG